MIITLKQSQIEEALVQYMQGKGLDTQNRQVEVSFTAGRGQNGLMATLEFGDFQKPKEQGVSPTLMTRSAEVEVPPQPEVQQAETVAEDVGEDVKDAAHTVPAEAPKKNIFAGKQ